jgi:hypothetical protein
VRYHLDRATNVLTRSHQDSGEPVRECACPFAARVSPPHPRGSSQSSEELIKSPPRASGSGEPLKTSSVTGGVRRSRSPSEGIKRLADRGLTPGGARPLIEEFGESRANVTVHLYRSARLRRDIRRHKKRLTLSFAVPLNTQHPCRQAPKSLLTTALRESSSERPSPLTSKRLKSRTT